MKKLTVLLTLLYSSIGLVYANPAHEIKIEISPSLTLHGEAQMEEKKMEWTVSVEGGAPQKSWIDSDVGFYVLKLRNDKGQERELLNKKYQSFSRSLTSKDALDVYTAEILGESFVAVLLIANEPHLLTCRNPFDENNKVNLVKLADYPLDRAQPIKLSLSSGKVVISKIIGTEVVQIPGMEELDLSKLLE